MTRWFMVTDDTDTVPGFVDADTPEAAIAAWAGRAFDSAPIYVIDARHVRRFEPQLPHHTRWVEAEDPEPARDSSGSVTEGEQP